jgi:hypothetical protein
MQLTPRTALALSLLLTSPAAALGAGPDERPGPTALDLERRLTARAWLGGTEPGTSRQALEGQLRWRGLDQVELQAGAGWTDNIFYEVSKGYGTAYWSYAEGSSLKGDLSVRRYGYAGGRRPTPDSAAYALVPRAELELSHRLGERLTAGLAYQLFAPDFFYDRATRVVNHKATAQGELKLGGGFSASALAAVLVDPDPRRTTIKDRPLPAAAPGTTCVAGVPSAGCAGATRVVTRSELLLGGGVAYRTEGWTASLRYIPNRDLDAGFAWSVLTGLELRPLERLTLELQWIRDRYSSVSGPTFAGKDGDILWGRGRWQFSPALALGGGLKWVANPSPASTSPTAGQRRDATLLLDLEWRSGLLPGAR